MENIDFHILQWFFGSTPILGLTLMMFIASARGKHRVMTTITFILVTGLWFIWKTLPNEIWHHMGANSNVGLYQHITFALGLGFATSSVIYMFLKTRQV